MPETSKQQTTDEFNRLAEKKSCSIITEFWLFLKYNKKWWLLPVIIILLVLGLLTLLSGTAIAPFIYPLF